VLAWELRPEGWAKVERKRGIESHAELRRMAEERALP
jgi:hypothetical protein